MDKIKPYFQTELGTLYKGDCLEVMKQLDSKSINSIITSPPYYNLREYSGNKNELGQEKYHEEYLLNLSIIFNELFRVLKNDGSAWINIGDTFYKKCLLMIPEKFAIKMIDNGWILRNQIIWKKPNACPESAKDRFTIDFEKFFFMVKKNNYKFNTQFEKTLHSANKTLHSAKSQSFGKYETKEIESKHRRGINKDRGSRLIEKRLNLPSKKIFVNELKKHFKKADLYNVPDIKKTTVDHWFRLDDGGFSFPTKSDWERVLEYFNVKIFPELLEVSLVNDEVIKNPDKRIKRSIWEINTNTTTFKHFASYPIDLLTTPIKSTTNKNDLILDCFMGSGTTAIACENLDRKWIGIEKEEKYCEIIKNRLIENSKQLKLFSFADL